MTPCSRVCARRWRPRARCSKLSRRKFRVKPPAGVALVPADHKVEGGPSVLFDAVAIIPSREGGAKLATQAEALNFLRDAFGHLKVIAYTPTAAPLLVKAGMPEANPDNDAGMISLVGSSPKDFVAAAAAGRIWAREPYIHIVQ